MRRSVSRGRVVLAAVLAALLDLALVLVFVLIGRRSHDEGDALAGVLVTLWPFAAALAVGWLVARAWRSPHRVWPSGVIVWAVTVVGGMLLRIASGQGVQWSFVIVTALVLAVFLLGRRALTGLIARRRSA